MGWGSELWDRLDNIEAQTADAIAFISHVRNLAAKVSEVEKEYAAKLLAAVKSVPPNSSTMPSTFDAAWKSLLHSMEERSRQHDRVADVLLAEVCQPLKQLVKDATQTRQDHLKDVAFQRSELAKHVATFDKRKKVYDKVEKEAEQAKYALKKIEDQPGQAKKADAARREFAKRAKAREEAERILEQDLRLLNNERTSHYFTVMPAIFDRMQAADEHRAEAVVQSFRQMLNSFKQSAAAEAQAVGAAEQACFAFDKGRDSVIFSDTVKSGKPLPKDMTLDDLKLNRDLELADRSSPRTQRRIGSVATVAIPDDKQYQVEQPTSIDEGPEAPAPAPAVTTKIRILYDFAGTNEGELAVRANEIVFLVDDDGSGWALAARPDGTQGYVPASYYQVV